MRGPSSSAASESLTADVITISGSNGIITINSAHNTAIATSRGSIPSSLGSSHSLSPASAPSGKSDTPQSDALSSARRVNGGMIAGIVLGVIVLFLLVVLFMVYRRRIKRGARNEIAARPWSEHVNMKTQEVEQDHVMTSSSRAEKTSRKARMRLSYSDMPPNPASTSNPTPHIPPEIWHQDGGSIAAIEHPPAYGTYFRH